MSEIEKNITLKIKTKLKIIVVLKKNILSRQNEKKRS